MNQKKERVLEIFYRLMMGNGISVSELAREYKVSTKSITRDINEIKNFIADHRELLSNTEIQYVAASKRYYMKLEHFLEPDELLALAKILIGCRALSKADALRLLAKLKQFTCKSDQTIINSLITNELKHYQGVNHDCDQVIDTLWQLTECIFSRQEITISYYKMNRDLVKRRIRPLAVTFSEYYFYLIGYPVANDEVSRDIHFYRVDRIVGLTRHRARFQTSDNAAFDEGDLMSRIQFMFPGKTRRIRFSFTGPSVQAVLDRIPRSRVVEAKGGETIIEAEVLGTGINMFLLSQGAWVKPLAPEEFVEEMRQEVMKMAALYD